ncbi:10529_t:CDS:10 [Diversispora eburnea]|uniref:10529_t:CDS:1 n=1 Tax=Diversispora eburnea TaxID=1213867 RepID=A0A9N9FUS9_9GLOM|nr:10529_t:CDS:10 [Diversispora eburnea]
MNTSEAKDILFTIHINDDTYNHLNQSPPMRINAFRSGVIVTVSTNSILNWIKSKYVDNKKRVQVSLKGKAEVIGCDYVILRCICSCAEEKGLKKPNTGCTIFEKTTGSTGISIAMVSRAKGYNAWIVVPDDQAEEKYQLLEKLGATVEKVRPVGIVDKRQYVNLAQTHYKGTGPEIFQQTNGKIDAFIAGAGTIAGISRYLKLNLKIYLVDPPGFGSYNKAKYNIMYLSSREEGLFLESSSAINCVGCVRVARQLGPGHRIVMMLNDSEFDKISGRKSPELIWPGFVLPGPRAKIDWTWSYKTGPRASSGPARNTSIKTDQNLSLEGNSLNVTDPTNKNLIYSIERTTLFSNNFEESKALTIKHSIHIKYYENTHKFPDPKYMFNLKARGLTTSEKFVSWWDQEPSKFSDHS